MWWAHYVFGTHPINIEFCVKAALQTHQTALNNTKNKNKKKRKEKKTETKDDTTSIWNYEINNSHSGRERVKDRWFKWKAWNGRRLIWFMGLRYDNNDKQDTLKQKKKTKTIWFLLYCSIVRSLMLLFFYIMNETKIHTHTHRRRS